MVEPLSSDEDIAAAHVGPPDVLDAPIVLAEYDPAWPRLFEREVTRIRAALRDRALLIEHVGSTAVPELAAKPRIDIVLAVADSSDKTSYLHWRPQATGCGSGNRIGTSIASSKAPTPTSTFTSSLPAARRSSAW